MNDLERARQKRADRKRKWRPVTNELVVTYANPDCAYCKGAGFLGDSEGEQADSADVCKCAEEMFNAANTERTRWNKSRNRMEIFT